MRAWRPTASAREANVQTALKLEAGSTSSWQSRRSRPDCIQIALRPERSCVTTHLLRNLFMK